MVVRPPVKWHGGKHYLVRRIVGCFPQHRIYLEPFGGGASVLLNKPPSEIEIYNDLDGRISRLFRVLRDRGQEFVQRAQFVLYSQAEFMAARQAADIGDEMDLALRDFVLWRQSFGGQGDSWSYTTTRSRGGMADVVNAWWTSIEGLPEITSRLRRVQILSQPAIEAIQRFDHPDALIYCDPPYVHATRSKGATDVYAVEMSDNDHRDLAEVLNGCQGRVLISGYPSALYSELYPGWRRVDFDIANHAAGGHRKARETECLWCSF
jgi:DNA adenine methylase